MARYRVKFDDDTKLHRAMADGSDEDGNTFCHHASRNGCIELLKHLGPLEVQTRNSIGQTALHVASNVDCAKWLIANGSKVNALDSNGQTPIFNATSVAVLKLLLDNGARADVKDVMNNTPLHYMLMRCHLPDLVSMIRLLIGAGADVNSRNHKMWTPLFYCAFADQDSNQESLKRLAVLLLNSGADPDMADMTGLTVAHYLALKRRADLLSVILPRMTCNVVSHSKQTVKDIVAYYYKDDVELCKLVRLLDNKPKRNYERSIAYQLKSKEVIDCYYRFNKGDTEIFDDWSERFKPRPYIERSMANKCLAKLNDSCSTNGKDLLDLSARYWMGTFHRDGKDEKCRIGQSVRQTLETVVKYLREFIDERYAFELLPIGSSADGSKLFLPDEFDYLLVSADSNAILNIRPTYFKAALSEAMKLAFITLPNDGDENLKYLFLEATNLLRKKLCYKVHFIWRGKQFRNIYISVDMTPVYRCTWHDQQFSYQWQMLSELNDAVPPERREFFVIVSDHAAKQVLITIPTIESWLLNSSGDHLHDAYKLLKLLLASFSIVSEIKEGLYNVKTALLNYAKKSGTPKDRESVPSYAMKVIESELIESDKLPKFGFDINRGYCVRNWCHGVRENKQFPLIKKLLL